MMAPDVRETGGGPGERPLQHFHHIKMAKSSRPRTATEHVQIAGSNGAFETLDYDPDPEGERPLERPGLLWAC